MKTAFISILFLIFSGLSGLSQKLMPGDISGTLYFRDEKIIEFTFLAAPDGKTDLTFYTRLPDRAGYDVHRNRTHFSLSQVNKIEFPEFTPTEEKFLHDSCQSCILHKATILFTGKTYTGPVTVYIDTPWFEWKNSRLEEFRDLRKVELSWLDRLTISIIRK